jgi:Ni,Fe-hydrogenase III large subunit
MRESVMQMCNTLTESRFLRGVNTVGGVTKDISSNSATQLAAFLSALRIDFTEVVDIATSDPSVENRLVTTGRIPRTVAEDLGAVGMPARSVGIPKDARCEYPYAAYDAFEIPIAFETEGDVQARFRIRIKEVYASIDIVLQALEKLEKGALVSAPRPLPDAGFVVSVVEGWRGEIAYVLIAEHATLTRVKVRDTSFISWQIVPHVIGSDIVPDFPLINKSFNLSYTGNDL